MPRAILVSSHEKITREGWRALATAGFSVSIVSAPRQARAAIDRAQADVVLLDATSDAVGARELIVSIREQRRGCIVLAIVDASAVQSWRRPSASRPDAILPFPTDGAGLYEQTRHGLSELLERCDTMMLQLDQLSDATPAGGDTAALGTGGDLEGAGRPSAGAAEEPARSASVPAQRTGEAGPSPSANDALRGARSARPVGSADFGATPRPSDSARAERVDVAALVAATLEGTDASVVRSGGEQAEPTPAVAAAAAAPRTAANAEALPPRSDALGAATELERHRRDALLLNMATRANRTRRADVQATLQRLIGEFCATYEVDLFLLCCKVVESWQPTADTAADQGAVRSPSAASTARALATFDRWSSATALAAAEGDGPLQLGVGTPVRPALVYRDRQLLGPSEATRVASGLELGWLIARIQRGAPLHVSDLRALPIDAAGHRQALKSMGLGSWSAVPIVQEGGVAGLCTFGRTRRGDDPQPMAERSFEVFADIIGGLLCREQVAARVQAPPAPTKSDAMRRWRTTTAMSSSRASSALGRQIAYASHLLHGHLSLLQVDPPGPASEGGTRELHAAIESAERLQRLSEQLLHLDDDPNRGASLEDVHLNELAVDLEPVLRAIASGGCEVSIVCEASSPWTRLDPVWLRRLVVHAVSVASEDNALDAVVVRTRDTSGGRNVELDVVLHGAARSPAMRTGFGAPAPVLLTAALEALLSAGAELGVPIELRRGGAEATLTLSFARQGRRVGTRSGLGRRTQVSANLRVLVVEDEPFLRRMVVRALTRLGYVVLEAGSAEEALERFGEKSESAEDISLLVTDVCLPHHTGTYLARELTKRRGPLRPLFMSGDSDQDSVSRDMGGEVAFLQKPFRQNDLSDRVHALLGEGA